MTVVYKYRGGDKSIFKRDLYTLKDNYFWASDASELNDPCEKVIDTDYFKRDIRNIISQMQLGNNKEVEGNLVKVCNELDQLINHDIGIFSLSKTFLDELLWAHYGNSHQGFCIGYELDILTKNNSLNKFIPITVEYSDTIPQVTISDMIQIKNDLKNNSLIKKFAATKSRRWITEQEIRLITNSPGRQNYDYRAVKSIYFGLRMNEEEKDKIMNGLKGREIKYFQIHLKEKTYEFYEKEVIDKYPTTAKYLHNIAPVSSEPISENQICKEYKEYIPYLYKAIEIARREPYCKLVFFADFKFSEIKCNKPEIFVNCEKTNNDFPNYYYTIEEIDKLYSQIDDINK
jgi:hypothetical protein